MTIQLLACPDCSSQLIRFDKFATTGGAILATLIVLVILSFPFLLRVAGYHFEPHCKKPRWRAAIPYLVFFGLWMWLMTLDEEFRPNYSRSDDTIQFSSILLYWIFFPFMLIYNVFLNPLLFFSNSVIMYPIFYLWQFGSPFIYGYVANKFDRQLLRSAAKQPPPQ